MNTCRVKYTSHNPFIWFNKQNLKFKKIKKKYEREKDNIKIHVFDGLTEEYKPLNVSCNINISNIAYKDIKK